MAADVVSLRTPALEPLRCSGGGRDSENDKALCFSFNRRPTDAELWFLVEVMGRAAQCSQKDTRNGG